VYSRKAVDESETHFMLHELFCGSFSYQDN